MTTTKPGLPLTVYTAEEVAKTLRCNRETVYRWVRNGRLKSLHRQANKEPFRFTQEHIDEFLFGPKTTEAPAPKPVRNPNRHYSK